MKESGIADKAGAKPNKIIQTNLSVFVM